MSVIWNVRRDLVDPEFGDDISELLGKSNFRWQIYRGWASPIVQGELYKRYLGGGPLAAKPGHSAHECTNDSLGAAALAVDVVRLDSKGGLHWDYGENGAWPWLWQACFEHPRLHSGHHFPLDTNGRVVADDDHIQAVKWYQYKARLVLAGKW